VVIRARIDEVLATIPDPELPVSIVELGLVKDVTLETNSAGSIARITLLPTFTGCPALDMIANDVRTKVGAVEGVDACEVTWCYEPAWTTDRISDSGRAQLKAHGVTVPTCQGGADLVSLRTSAIACPYCQSNDTRLDSPYGPTRCRSIYFCEACRNQFEHMKSISDGA
jgi:ring-1,2-phenylacetyl-CoA epoxidase subunit PaaD